LAQAFSLKRGIGGGRNGRCWAAGGGRPTLDGMPPPGQVACTDGLLWRRRPRRPQGGSLRSPPAPARRHPPSLGRDCEAGPRGEGESRTHADAPLQRAAAQRELKEVGIQFHKSYRVLAELFDSPAGLRLLEGLQYVPGGFRFLDLGAAPGGFSACLLDLPACAWGVGLTLQPEVGFPMLLGCHSGAAFGRYDVHCVDILQLGARYLSSALAGEPVDLCLCDCQDMRERHGPERPAAQRSRARRGFVGAYGGSYSDPEAPWAHLRPRTEGLGIWALTFHQIGLSLSQLRDCGRLLFRFSWVLSIYDKCVEHCDRGYYDATLRLMHLLAMCFDTVDIFKSAYFHTCDSTCYVMCDGLLLEHLHNLMGPFGGVEAVFARSALQVLRFESIDELPTASCLDVLSYPQPADVAAIRSLLEKVTALREIARAEKGLSNGRRYAHVESGQRIIGQPIGRSITHGYHCNPSEGKTLPVVPNADCDAFGGCAASSWTLLDIAGPAESGPGRPADAAARAEGPEPAPPARPSDATASPHQAPMSAIGQHTATTAEESQCPASVHAGTADATELVMSISDHVAIVEALPHLYGQAQATRHAAVHTAAGHTDGDADDWAMHTATTDTAGSTEVIPPLPNDFPKHFHGQDGPTKHTPCTSVSFMLLCLLLLFLLPLELSRQVQ